jgi:UDP-N-acetylmuramate--alanine ligase
MLDGLATTGLVEGLPERLHLIGVGGAGLSGAARLLLARGHHLTGHDRERSAFTCGLETLGMPLALGRSAAACLPGDAQGVVRSAAIPDDDPQVALARQRGLPIWKYAELLPLLSPPGRTLGVAGTHGKTTTSWLLYHALRGLPGPAPGALVGGLESKLVANAIAPEPGGWFSVEACEYDRSFLHLAPVGGIVTNLEADHLDYYQDMENLEGAFARFADLVHPDGLLVLGPEVPDRIANSAACEVWRLGRELRIDLLAERRGNFGFRLRGPGWATPPTALGIPGAFNVENAALALGLTIGLAARELGVLGGEVASDVARSLGDYRGAARRFESWGEVGRVSIVHDYAHHPTEVAATLETARRVYPGQPLHVLFQPHQHSRTARMLSEFVESLRSADRVVVADVYGARNHIDQVAAGAEELASRLRRAGVDAVAGGDCVQSSATQGQSVERGPRRGRARLRPPRVPRARRR